MKTLARIYRGMRYSEKYGEHPGNVWIICFLLMGAIAGADKDFFHSLMGAIIMAVIFGPLYLLGCYERGDV